MKKLSKIILSVAAATVVTAAMAVTAMAADTITGTYDNETGVVTMEGVIGSGASQTLLVFKNAAEEITSNDIAYINQIDNSGTFSKFTLAAGLKPAKAGESVTYNIKVGGTDGTVQTGTLTIAGDAPATVTIIIGDANSDKAINMTDVNRIVRYIRDDQVSSKATGDTGKIKTKPDGNEIIVGDANSDKAINMTDVNRIVRYIRDDQVSSKATGDTGLIVDVLDDTSAE